MLVNTDEILYRIVEGGKNSNNVFLLHIWKPVLESNMDFYKDKLWEVNDKFRNIVEYFLDKVFSGKIQKQYEIPQNQDYTKLHLDKTINKVLSRAVKSFYKFVNTISYRTARAIEDRYTEKKLEQMTSICNKLLAKHIKPSIIKNQDDFQEIKTDLQFYKDECISILKNHINTRFTITDRTFV